jgi:hypothetical protein
MSYFIHFFCGLILLVKKYLNLITYNIIMNIIGNSIVSYFYNKLL